MITPKQMNKALIAIIVILITITVAGLYVANQKLTAVASETTRLTTEIEVSKKQIKIYELTKFKLESLSAINETLGEILPEQEEQSLIVAELSGFAKRSSPSLAVAGIEFKEPLSSADSKKSSIPKSVKVLPITITFKGVQYEGVVDFLREVEVNRRTMQVNNIGLKQNEDNNAAIDVTISMNLYAKNSGTGVKQ